MANMGVRLALLLVAAAWPSSRAAVPPRGGSCQAGDGYATNSTTCVQCGAGTWSGEGSTECTRCVTGTYSTVAGAGSEDTCSKCPQGTWSAQEGSPTPGSCQKCPAGSWGGATGLGSQKECTKCPAGTWSSQEGATSDGVCSVCLAGTWSGENGSNSATHCLDCAPGTWSSTLGSSEQSSCTACPSGTWSTAWGAAAESTCQECRAGTFQPAVGQANVSVCIPCEPGKYSTLTGVDACAACPAGTWTDEFEVTACKICPAGMWSYSSGARLESNCVSCSGSSCLAEGSARVSIELRGLQYQQSTSTEQADLRVAFARDIALAAGVDVSLVVDLMGQNSSVTMGQDGSISAFLLDLEGVSARDLATRFYNDAFRETLVNSTIAVLGSRPEHLGAGAITVEPEHFVPLQPTTTSMTSTSTAAITSTSSSSVVTTTTAMHKDIAFTTTGLSSDTTMIRVTGLTWLLIAVAPVGSTE